MKKMIFSFACVLFAVSFVLVGCSAQAASTVNGSNQHSQDVAKELDQLSAGEYIPLREFADQHIPSASPEIAGSMVRALIAASEKELSSSNSYIYGENARNIQKEIVAAISSDLVAADSVICGQNKLDLLEAMSEGEVKKNLSSWLASGLGLYNAEGTYFFVVDYVEYLQAYEKYVDDATAAFLNLAAVETKKPMLVSEILSADANELGDRAIAYETFLVEYPDFSMKDTVRTYFNAAVSKLASPTMQDQLVDAYGRVTTNCMVVYERLAERQDCPVLQQVAKSMLDFIAAQPDGIIVHGYDTDMLGANASEVVKAAQDQADSLYETLED